LRMMMGKKGCFFGEYLHGGPGDEIADHGTHRDQEVCPIGRLRGRVNCLAVFRFQRLNPITPGPVNHLDAARVHFGGWGIIRAEAEHNFVGGRGLRVGFRPRLRRQLIGPFLLRIRFRAF